MRYMVRKSVIDILGGIWMPYGAQCSIRKVLSAYDIENMRDEDGQITRESVEQWVLLNSGDFSTVTDFSASIEDGDHTIDLPWSSEENELAYCDTIAEPE